MKHFKHAVLITSSVADCGTERIDLQVDMAVLGHPAVNDSTSKMEDKWES